MANLGAVTDTHALVLYAANSSKLGPLAKRHFSACDQGTAIVYVPVAVIWEVGTLARGGRIDLGRSTRAFFGALFANPAFQPLDLTAAQVFLADEFRFARDPFDALIVAAALDLSLPLITGDETIRESKTVAVLW